MPGTRVVSFAEAETSRERTLAYLLDHGTITTLRAISEWGEHRLAARIGELREEGYDITSVWCRAMNGKRYVEYEFVDHPGLD